MYNVTITKKQDVFDRLDVPKIYGNKIICHLPMKLQCGKTYYTAIDGKITAFRVLAYSIKATGIDNLYNPTYLVRLPNKEPKWINGFIKENTIVCDSKEQMIQYPITNQSLDLGWGCISDMFPEFKEFYSERLSYITLKGKVWKKNNFTPSTDFYPNILRFMVVDNEAFFLIDSTYFLTKEDCVKSILDGCVIEEFDEYSVIEKINFNTTTKSKNKTYILRFVEE